MILKASTRSDPVALGRHLTNEQDNDHVEPHEVRGFISDDVMSAMRELHGVSQGIRSRQPIFSVSLSPPPTERVGIEVFERAIDEIERRNGLTDQPRIVIFHEKEGRRHAHAVWSRVNVDTMTAIPLPHFKSKLRDLSREIYLEQQWQVPRGLIDKRDRNPANYDLALYQQAKREGIDPKQIKLAAKEAWAISDSRVAIEKALQERGLYLARGDRRSHVIMTWRGQVMALARQLDLKTKHVRARLGNADQVRSIEETRAHVAATRGPMLERLIGEADRREAERMQPLEAHRLAMKHAHSKERRRMDAGIAARQDAERRERSERLRKGLSGLLDRLTGRHEQVRAQNEREALQAMRRDRAQRQALRRDRAQRQAMIDAQLDERATLQVERNRVRRAHGEKVAELFQELSRQLEADRSPQKRGRQQWLDERQQALARERCEWLMEQQRRPEPQPRATEIEDRAQWLRQQQRRPAPELRADPTSPQIAPQFNHRAAAQSQPQTSVPRPTPHQQRQPDPPRTRGPEPQR